MDVDRSVYVEVVEVHEYLVVMQCGMDDVPLQMFYHFDNAKAFAMTQPWQIPDEIAKALRLDTITHFSVISIYRFERGKPVERTIVRDFEKEGEK